MAGFPSLEGTSACFSSNAIVASQDASPESFIPWHDTTGSKDARVVLKMIFDSYPNNSSVGKYLLNNCAHLLESPEGDTGIKLDEVAPSSIPNQRSSFTLTSSFTPTRYPGNAGLYCVTNS